MKYNIREIEEKDNKEVENVIRACLIEFGANHEGTAWADPNLGRFSEIYNTDGNKYLVAIDENGKIVGGVGIGKLDGIEDVCELQKMYCLPETRGTGISHKLMDMALEYAKKYLEANEKAIKNIKRIVDEEQIDCDFEIKPAYVFAQKEDEVLDIEKEVNAVNKLGKKAEYVNKIKYFPIQIKGAIKFENQAQFHPRKYMLGLCKSILTQNKIYENTTALEVERSGNNYIIHTDKGDIETEKIVIATHYPILNMPGFYFLKMYQETSYLIAIETKSKLPQEMYINVK